MNPTYHTDVNVTHCSKRVEWRPIFAGAVAAVGLTFLFNLLTLGIGLTEFVTTQEGMQRLAIVGFAWLFIGGFLMLFIAGWIAGRGVCHGSDLHSCHGMTHGFLAWCVYLLISLFLLASLPNAMITNSLNNVTTGNFAMTPDRTNVDEEDGASTTTRTTNTATPVQNMTPAERAKTEQAAQAMGVATIATFVIFLGGALGATIGGMFGIARSRHCRTM